ncbi:AraC-type DNA-binding protein [Nonomuraea solani]|uniref:AraC-type DNA-binding protein n=1 Tax=Nonomuraea solani TaxID=1144553 RepID=A0A1H6EQH2_9ACTN|nr:AraC family transcriptional regulator [Nonomuraea solani]SEG99185.1 AraC-type DNA-binding protein [Nonomuraea solani]
MQVRDVNGTQLAVLTPASGGFPRHSHDEYVIGVNLCGRERVRLDRSSFEVDLDEVTVYNPGQVQSCTTHAPEGAAFTCVSWYVPPSTLTALTGGPPPDFERPVVRAPRLRAHLLKTAHDLTAYEAGPPATSPGPATYGTGSAEATPDLGVTGSAEIPLGLTGPTNLTAWDTGLTEERLTLVLLRLLDLISVAARRPADLPAAGDARIAAVLDRLRGDLTSAPRLADLAHEAGMSREHLVRSFTRATGCPPYAWHLQARLAEGRRRLRRGEPVAEVAHGLGFADQAHFHRHFLAAYAITPGRYRAINI